jgi:hypothetical protein
VIQELGEGAQDNKSSLYNRFLATYKKRSQRSKEVRFKNWLKLRSIRHGRFFSFSTKEGGIGILFNFALTFIWEINYNFFTWLILSSARIFIIFWVIMGALSLVMGVATNLEATNPLYTTGQTWVGIAVTIGYSFFGLDRKSAPKDETDQKNNNANQGANGRGDGEEAESREGTKFTNERGETKDIKTRHELMKELESQLAEAEEEMRAAIEEGDIDGEVNLHKKVIKLKRKLKEETKATAGGDANSS